MNEKGNNLQKNSEIFWDNYVKAVEVWKQSYQQWQKTGREAFKLYLKGYQYSIKNSNFSEMKKYNESWENAMQNLHETPYSIYQKAWNDVWTESGFTSFKAFSDYWQKSWKNFSQETANLSASVLKNIEKNQTELKK